VSHLERFCPGERWSLWDIMHKLRADHFFKAYEQASVFHQALTSCVGPNEINFQSSSIITQRNMLESLASELELIGMPSSAVCVRRAVDVLSTLPDGPETLGQQTKLISVMDRLRLQRELAQATSRIADDFTVQDVLILDARKRMFYNNARLFGDDVFAKFQSANDDIFEAGMCLALDRGTACVLHLMRVLEAGLGALAKTVGVEK